MKRIAIAFALMMLIGISSLALAQDLDAPTSGVAVTPTPAAPSAAAAAQWLPDRAGRFRGGVSDFDWLRSRGWSIEQFRAAIAARMTGQMRNTASSVWTSMN